MSRRFGRLRTVPGRIRAATAGLLLLLAALFAVAGVAFWDVHEALRAIGHDEGPTVVATSDVTLALSDMDAQVTNVLLAGREAGWRCDPDQLPAASPVCAREHPRHLYDIRRADAQRAALQAVRLAGSDPVRLRTVQSVLDGLQQYDRRVQAAMELGSRTEHAFGALPEDAAREYRAATTIMTQDLLPKATNLTLESAALVDDAYQQERAGVQTGRIGVIVAGGLVLVAIGALQVYLTAQFRRLISPYLLVAALGTLTLTVLSASQLATQAEYLRAAKEAGFDPVLTLSRARATGKSLDADRTRFLLDPTAADRYDQTYLEKSQTMLHLPTAYNLDSYYAMLDKRLRGAGGDIQLVTTSGFYAEVLDPEKTDGLVAEWQRESLRRLLTSYRQYQFNDNLVRELAGAGQRDAAARAHMDANLPYLPHHSFRAHDDALAIAVSKHQYVINRIVPNADRALRPWLWLLPGFALFITVLVVAGVRPRLAEYR